MGQAGDAGGISGFGVMLAASPDALPDPTATTRCCWAFVATYRTMNIRHVLGALDWTEDRFNAPAFATAQAHLAATLLSVPVGC